MTLRNERRSTWVALLALVVLATTAFAVVGTSRAQQLDMDVIFRCHGDSEEDRALCDEGRDLIVNNCTSCHTFVPIVLQQFEAEGWEGLLDRHRGRVSHLSDEQVATIHAYVSANFNPEQEPPPLPPAMLQNWTSY